MRLRKALGRLTAIRVLYFLLSALRHQYGFQLARGLRDLATFGLEYRAYRRMNSNPNFHVSARWIRPYLRDRTPHTPLDPWYFLQDTWGAHKVSEIAPAHHVDVGSSAVTVGILSQFVPTTMIDIRALPVHLDGLSFRAGSILSLPFEDGSVESLSSLCVVEHIGLGRYGDAVDPWGSEKSFAELRRVLKPGGHLIISLQMDPECRVHFNAHRTFTPAYVMSLADPDLQLQEERYIYNRCLHTFYDPSQPFSIGLFHFRKRPSG